MPPPPHANVRVRAYAPGRVNLIGDHTDYSGGLVMPMAIDRGTSVVFTRGGTNVELRSTSEARPARVRVGEATGMVPSRVQPPWARYVAGVVAVLTPSQGGTGVLRCDLPIGAGLSSSAALEVCVALALGFEGTPLALAQACREAEELASGVPCGIMDQLASVAGVAGHALVIDCSSCALKPVALPAGAEVLVVHSGQSRRLAQSSYALRRAEVERAAASLGPLRSATLEDLNGLRDRVLRRRARHVVTENARVEAFAAALGAAELDTAGALMVESHRSLDEDFEVSTPALDATVQTLLATPGVFGARLTGAGFGGCVVALAEQGTADRLERGWLVRASAGAEVLPYDGPAEAP